MILPGLPSPPVSPPPRGLSFSIPEHLLIRGWAARNNLRMATELDRVIGDDEFEEVLAFYDAESSWRRLVMWRKAGAVVVEPTWGAARQFPNMRAAIEAASALLRGTGGARVLRHARLRKLSFR